MNSEGQSRRQPSSENATGDTPNKREIKDVSSVSQLSVSAAHTASYHCLLSRLIGKSYVYYIFLRHELINYNHHYTYIITSNVCLNDIASTDGGHSHTQYVDDHEINEMKEEFDNKTAELEVKILALEAKESYQQYLFLSFLQQLHSISSGIHYKCTNIPTIYVSTFLTIKSKA